MEKLEVTQVVYDFILFILTFQFSGAGECSAAALLPYKESIL